MMFVSEVENAFKRRTKSLNHRTKSFSVGWEESGSEHELDERLVVDAQLLQPNPTHVRLHVWLDGEMWLGVHQASKSGWLVNIEIRGRLSRMNSQDIVLAFENSLATAFASYAESERMEVLLKNWKQADAVPHGAA